MGGHTLTRREGTQRSGVAWFGPYAPDESAELARWGRSVGPPVVRAAPSTTSSLGDTLTVISWNIALGGGDVVRLVRTVREQIGADAPLVLLLQEAYRGGREVPTLLGSDSRVAGRLRGTMPNGGREDITRVADQLQLALCYVPSMRNGSPSESDEDRGNAILSNLPLDDVAAIELPFERQRRVAVAASVAGFTSRGAPWTVRLVSAHLDNRVGARRGWIVGAEYARTRQARGLVTVLADGTPLVLGGDFNTWFGFSDQAYFETQRAFPQTRVHDRRATFHGMLRLDHMFFRLPDSWTATFHRENDRFGSDHYPLTAKIRF